jgi:hypothetical protein
MDDVMLIRATLMDGRAVAVAVGGEGHAAAIKIGDDPDLVIAGGRVTSAQRAEAVAACARAVESG